MATTQYGKQFKDDEWPNKGVQVFCKQYLKSKDATLREGSHLVIEYATLLQSASEYNSDTASLIRPSLSVQNISNSDELVRANEQIGPREENLLIIEQKLP